MRVLFIHQNFPGQFRYLAPTLAAQGHEVRALAISPRMALPGVTVHPYAPAPPSRWPIADLVELIDTLPIALPNRRFTALSSIVSAIVEVPCALM